MRGQGTDKNPVIRWPALMLLMVLSMTLSTAFAVEKPPHYELQVFLDPQAQQLDVTGTLTSGPHDGTTVQLSQHFELRRLSVNGVDTDPARVALDRAENRVDFSYSADLADYSGDQLLISEAGSYLPDSANWYPVLANRQSFTYQLQLSTIAGQKIVASGRIVNERDDDAGYNVAISSDHMARAINLYAGPYQIHEAIASGKRLRSYFHEDLSSLADGYLQSTAEYIEGYEAMLGDYPFSGFFIVSAPFSAGYGYPGLTYIGQRVLRLPFIRATSLRHEILHNYWGNGVYVDYRNGNWAEGLTTYLADYETARQRGGDEARKKRYQWLRDFAALPPERDRPARYFISKVHGASQVIGYHKVAFLFHSLRREMGERQFNAMLQQFWQQHQFRVASWADIAAIAKSVSQRELSGFFAQYLDRTGAAELVLENVSAKVRGQSWQIAFSLSQRGELYELSVPVVVVDEKGEKHRFVVEQQDRQQKHSGFSIDARPATLHIDPDFDLFRRLTDGETPPVLRDLFLSTNPEIEMASDDEIVAGLVNRLLDSPQARTAAPGENAPLLVIGYTEDIQARLRALNLGAVPVEVQDGGTARVWSGVTDTGRAFAVVSADNSDAMRSLYRPLPHYGRQGYLVFDGSRAIAKGTWPLQQTTLSHRFGD